MRWRLAAIQMGVNKDELGMALIEKGLNELEKEREEKEREKRERIRTAASSPVTVDGDV